MNAPAPNSGRLAVASPGETDISSFDRQALLTAFLQASATARAEEIYDGLRSFTAGGDHTPDDLARHIEEGGLAPLLAWADVVTLAGFGREPWARESALRAVRAYTGRLADLMDASGAGGRP